MNSKGEASSVIPVTGRIIGCGHRHFLSQKSGLQFPAFLIQFAEKSLHNSNTEQDIIYRYQWRSKRDFIMLKRSSTSNPKTDFPKNAFSNLCEQAVAKPWLRPLSQVEFQAERENILATLDLHDFDPKTSGYQPRMKKSIMRLEDFLENHIDCGAWAIFCRNEDGAGIMNLTTATDGEMNKLKLEVDTTRRAAKLSQYFTSPSNAQMVMDKALHFCQHFHRSEHADYSYTVPKDESIQEWSPFVFVEPSCGDGRILQQLVDGISSTFHTNRQRHCILAYDIDEHLIVQCKERFTSSAEISFSIQCNNFLELTGDKLKEEITRIRDTSDNFYLVFVGNPPYSSGCGSGSTISRDLPSQFMTHSIVNLRAAFVSFIVPKRCNNEVKKTQKVLEKETQATWNCDSHELENSLFSFQGDVVKQPSVLQCWHKSTSSK